jgi:hypothetical protein
MAAFVAIFDFATLDLSIGATTEVTGPLCWRMA